MLLDRNKSRAQIPNVKATGHQSGPNTREKWLRVCSIPFITYLVAAPLLLLIGRALEPTNPASWGGYVPRSYDREIAKAFMTAVQGYLIATGALLILATIWLFVFKNEKMFRRLMLFVLVGIVCGLVFYATAALPKVR